MQNRKRISIKVSRANLTELTPFPQWEAECIFLRAALNGTATKRSCRKKRHGPSMKVLAPQSDPIYRGVKKTDTSPPGWWPFRDRTYTRDDRVSRAPFWRKSRKFVRIHEIPVAAVLKDTSFYAWNFVRRWKPALCNKGTRESEAGESKSYVGESIERLRCRNLLTPSRLIRPRINSLPLLSTKAILLVTNRVIFDYRGARRGKKDDCKWEYGRVNSSLRWREPLLILGH